MTPAPVLRGGVVEGLRHGDHLAGRQTPAAALVRTARGTSSIKPYTAALKFRLVGCVRDRRLAGWVRGRTAAMPALAIRHDRSAAELRRLARCKPDRRAAMRLLAIASALELDCLPRAEAARLAGIERQALRDAVLRDSAEGPPGAALHDRPRSGRPERLAPGQQAALKAWVLRCAGRTRSGTG